MAVAVLCGKQCCFVGYVISDSSIEKFPLSLRVSGPWYLWTTYLKDEGHSFLQNAGNQRRSVSSQKTGFPEHTAVKI